jgi:hypothetical protein
MPEEKKIIHSQGIQFNRPKPVPPPPAPLEQAKNRGKRRGLMMWVYIVGTVVLVTLLVLGSREIYLHFKHTDDSNTVIQDVGKLIELPQNEEPTIATVTDPEALKTEAFFKDAKVGDKLLVYSKSKKAILYRPDTHTIVAVGPLLQ